MKNKMYLVISVNGEQNEEKIIAWCASHIEALNILEKNKNNYDFLYTQEYTN